MARVRNTPRPPLLALPALLVVPVLLVLCCWAASESGTCSLAQNRLRADTEQRLTARRHRASRPQERQHHSPASRGARRRRDSQAMFRDYHILSNENFEGRNARQRQQQGLPKAWVT